MYLLAALIDGALLTIPLRAGQPYAVAGGTLCTKKFF